MDHSIGYLLRDATRQLRGLANSPRLDAEVLLAHCLRKSRSYLHAWPESEVESGDREKFARQLARRARGEPLAYLTGEREFWSLPLRVSPDTLIPRPDTELLVAAALAHCPPHARILELGTGSGAIAIAVSRERPDAHIVATDVSDAALAIARENARRHGATRIVFERAAHRDDWYGAVGAESFDLLISNPPYVSDDDPGFAGGEIRFEPRIALAAGVDGLRDLRCIVAGAAGHLAPSGWLLVEHGSEQAGAVTEMMRSAGLEEVETAPDLAGLPRVSKGRKTSP